MPTRPVAFSVTRCVLVFGALLLAVLVCTANGAKDISADLAEKVPVLDDVDIVDVSEDDDADDYNQRYQDEDAKLIDEELAIGRHLFALKEHGGQAAAEAAPSVEGTTTVAAATSTEAEIVTTPIVPVKSFHGKGNGSHDGDDDDDDETSHDQIPHNCPPGTHWNSRRKQCERKHEFVLSNGAYVAMWIIFSVFCLMACIMGAVQYASQSRRAKHKGCKKQRPHAPCYANVHPPPYEEYYSPAATVAAATDDDTACADEDVAVVHVTRCRAAECLTPEEAWARGILDGEVDLDATYDNDDDSALSSDQEYEYDIPLVSQRPASPSKSAAAIVAESLYIQDPDSTEALRDNAQSRPFVVDVAAGGATVPAADKYQREFILPASITMPQRVDGSNHERYYAPAHKEQERSKTLEWMRKQFGSSHTPETEHNTLNMLPPDNYRKPKDV